MKKIDVVIIAIVLIIGVSLFSFYYDRFNISTEDAIVVIKYQNITLAELDYDESLNYTYSIYAEDLEHLTVLIEQDGVEIEREIFDVNLNRNIRNKVILSYEKIYMPYEPHPHDKELDWPNCPDKNCTFTYMDKTHVLPIVCINGVSVEFVSQNNEIPIPIS